MENMEVTWGINNEDSVMKILSSISFIIMTTFEQLCALLNVICRDLKLTKSFVDTKANELHRRDLTD